MRHTHDNRSGIDTFNQTSRCKIPLRSPNSENEIETIGIDIYVNNVNNVNNEHTQTFINRSGYLAFGPTQTVIFK